MNQRFMVDPTVQRPTSSCQQLQIPRLPTSLRPHQPRYPSYTWIVICVILCIGASTTFFRWCKHCDIASSAIYGLTFTANIDVADFWPQSRHSPPSVNHALLSGGARIIHHLTSPTYNPQREDFRRQVFAPIYALRDEWLGFKLSELHLSIPRDAIRDTPYNRCWEFTGHHGHITVALPSPVFLTHVSMGTPLAVGSLEVPKSVRVWALVDDKSLISSSASVAPHFFARAGAIPQEITTRRFIRLADFQLGRNHDFHPVTTAMAGYAVDTIVFEVLSNHGGNFTCLYRLGAYGTP